jgi:hypothetical protein
MTFESPTDPYENVEMMYELSGSFEGSNYISLKTHCSRLVEESGFFRIAITTILMFSCLSLSYIPFDPRRQMSLLIDLIHNSFNGIHIEGYLPRDPSALSFLVMMVGFYDLPFLLRGLSRVIARLSLEDFFTLCDEMICRDPYVREMAVQVYGEDVIAFAMRRICEVAVALLIPRITFFITSAHARQARLCLVFHVCTHVPLFLLKEMLEIDVEGTA